MNVFRLFQYLNDILNILAFMKSIFLFLISIFILSAAQAQIDLYKEELLNMSDVRRLAYYRTGEMHQLSSWDRSGGNDDGFSGKYSTIRKEKEGWVIADLKGPGIVNRIWTPTPEADTIKFFFDGESSPRISIPFIDLFNGKQTPFIAPFCGTQLGGYFCLLPIPYQKSLKILYTGNNLRFHQIQYRTLNSSETISTFTNKILDKYSGIVKMINDNWGKKVSPLAVYGSILKSKKINTTLKSGEETTIFELSSGGRVAGIEFGAGSDFLQSFEKVIMKANWDGENHSAVDMPLHNFFGFAFGKPAMQNFILGTDQQKAYAYMPMPFDKSASIKLTYKKITSSDPAELNISGTIYYIDEKRTPEKEGKFYVQSRRQYNIPKGTPYLISNVKGRGHYIGTVLITQGLENGSTYYFEGDDIATIDGEMRLHGTGSEDYFNGGYYAIFDKWDTRMSLPTHGSIAYDLATSRTGGYRFYLADKLNFDDSFRLTIEHQPEDQTQVKTDYQSMAMFYADKPIFENTNQIIEEKTKTETYRERLTPQGMFFSLYWNASADYQDPAIVFSLKKMDSWTQNVDIDAVPLAQLSLH